VLLARIKAVLRRSTPISTSLHAISPLQIGDLILDPDAHTVTIHDKPVELSPKEFELLHTFTLQPRSVISVDDLLARVWGAEYMGQPQVVYVHIRWLREKIEENPSAPRRILTIRGVGYKFEPQET
jgi:DNA-binding response OmpR family regulator